MITVYPKQMPAVVEALRQMPEVRSLQSVSGIWDLAATGVVPTIGDMDALTDRIGAVDGVERTTSSLVLSTKFERSSRSTVAGWTRGRGRSVSARADTGRASGREGVGLYGRLSGVTGSI